MSGHEWFIFIVGMNTGIIVCLVMAWIKIYDIKK